MTTPSISGESDPKVAIAAARLRGHVGAAGDRPETDAGRGLGSRDLGNYLTSPCQRVRLTVAAGVKATAVAATTYGIDVRREPSDIASFNGRRFEYRLLASKGERLKEIYCDAMAGKARLLGVGGVPVDPSQVEVINCDPDDDPEALDVEIADDGATSGDRVSNEVLLARTLEFVATAQRHLAEGKIVILLQPTLKLVVNAVAHYLRPDLMVCGPTEWRIGEIKVYLDRDGETSGIEVASTVRQAAVGVIAARESLAELGVPPISSDVDVLFRRHTYAGATITRLNAQAEVSALNAGIEDAGRLLVEWSSKGVSLDSPEGVESVPNHYTRSCENGCPLNAACKSQKERDAGRVIHHHPGVISTELFGVTGERAMALADGAPPVDGEEHVARWLSEGWGP